MTASIIRHARRKIMVSLAFLLPNAPTQARAPYSCVSTNIHSPKRATDTHAQSARGHDKTHRLAKQDTGELSTSLKLRTASVGANCATFELSGLTVHKDEIVEWGFARNYQGMPMSARDMAKVANAGAIPTTKRATVSCHGLLPGERYRVTLYVKTRSGATIYSPEKIIETLPGLRWGTENWVITKHAVRPTFYVKGDKATVGQVIFCFGPKGRQRPYRSYQDNKGMFTTELITGLKPATDYVATVTANINGHRQTISKTVRTLTDYSSYAVDHTVRPASHAIRWDTTRVTLSPDSVQAEYPRLLRVSADTILLTYHGGDGTAPDTDHWHDIYLQRSTDNGKTWAAPTKLLNRDSVLSTDSHGWRRFADPTLTRLSNGWILLQLIGNARPETNENCQVMVFISKDGGDTWGDPITVGRGRTWEPQIVQLPGGELELLVSSEAYWWERQRDHLLQEILYARSTDNGQTWTALKRAAFNPNCRDGMPVPISLQGNKGVLFSIESIYSDDNPTLVYRELNNDWDSASWTGTNTPHRWVNENIRGACAPYLLQLPTGETALIGYKDQSGQVWQTCRTAVSIGDNTGREFKYRTQPFATLPAGEGAYYGSLFLKDDSTIWLAITHSRYKGETCVKNDIQYIEGKIIETKQNK